MQFLSISVRKIAEFGAEAFTPELTAAEGARIRELYAEGLLRQVWRRGDMPGACIVWEAETENDVRSRLQSLPIFKRGMLEIVSIIPLAPYPGFGPPQP
jgi:muconolactone delta-isomerase